MVMRKKTFIKYIIKKKPCKLISTNEKKNQEKKTTLYECFRLYDIV